MIIIIIGNLIAFIASISMVIGGLKKEKKSILYFEIIQIGLYVISNILLGGYTGAIINVLNCIRDFLCYKEKLGTREKIIILIFAISLSIIFNNLGWIGILPLIASIIYICFMNTKDIVKFKLLIVFSLVMWLIYDLSIKSYTSSAFDFFSILANTISILQLLKKNKLKIKN